MHEMGEMERAQEPRVDEVSLQIIRENHETMQKLTSQLQDMQDQMSSMNDSGEFQEVESNYSGRFSHVSSQLAMIPSSRSFLSRDKRVRLDTWIHPEIILKDFNLNDVQRNREAVTETGKDKHYAHKWRQTEPWDNSNADICNEGRGLRVLLETADPFRNWTHRER